MYPKLKQFDSPSEYALKRNPRLRQLQEQKAKPAKVDREDELISIF